jgi:hypothetical protein
MSFPEFSLVTESTVVTWGVMLIALIIRLTTAK